MGVQDGHLKALELGARQTGALGELELEAELKVSISDCA